jgi:hypothetical protein
MGAMTRAIHGATEPEFGDGARQLIHRRAHVLQRDGGEAGPLAATSAASISSIRPSRRSCSRALTTSANSELKPA